MEIMDKKDNGKLDRVKKRVEELKGFYIHFAVYIMVNTFISIMKVVRNLGDGEGFSEAFWDFGTFAVWLFWGIGLFFHGVKVFSYNPFFGKDWEKRQIQKYMDKDIKESKKYR
ncbi:2TM domain-containing protein [Maribacter polysiphoniae]|uniref:2TM domain-containing protein n=1 Tax=Maribacter polysiphoniae TaxID=429344 RepID=A0A316E2P9_9FLAO|nr:2TM domain-containing protein [Maribacter polysiphoniae]MBD1261100.1 2TM domain-containing protein [Maribacter polysiphoniae]PWK23659.1 2TM domain-containing protein [Maribacter polysiphoniae]